MIVIKSLVVFAVLALVHSDNADETTLLNVWKCIKPKLHAGIPEIDVPSYDPYLLPFNLTFGAEIIVFKRFFIVNHILVYGLLDADLQIKQLSKDTDNVASLEWSVDLPSIFIDAFWDSIINTNGTDIQTHGKMNMTLTDAHFEGTLNIEKPLFKGSITEYKITKNSVADAVVGVSDMNEVLTFIFDRLFKYIWKFIISSHVFANVLQGPIEKTFQKYLDDPDLLKVLLDGCSV